MVCRCGITVVSPVDERTCQKCGGPCCSSCALTLDATDYCAACAETVLRNDDVSLGRPIAAMVWPRSAPLETPRARADAEDKARWIILVARDQPDLYDHLERAFAHDDKVEVIMDRRRNYSRNPPGLEERLRTHGAAVVRRRDP